MQDHERTSRVMETLLSEKHWDGEIRSIMEFLLEVVGLQGLRISVTDNQVIYTYTYICIFWKSVTGGEVYAADIRSLQSASIPGSLGPVLPPSHFPSLLELTPGRT